MAGDAEAVGHIGVKGRLLLLLTGHVPEKCGWLLAYGLRQDRSRRVLSDERHVLAVRSVAHNLRELHLLLEISLLLVKESCHVWIRSAVDVSLAWIFCRLLHPH